MLVEAGVGGLAEVEGFVEAIQQEFDSLEELQLGFLPPVDKILSTYLAPSVDEPGPLRSVRMQLGTLWCCANVSFVCPIQVGPAWWWYGASCVAPGHMLVQHVYGYV